MRVTGEKTYIVLVEESKGKSPRCRQQDNIKTDIKETGCESVDWMNLAQERSSGVF